MSDAAAQATRPHPMGVFVGWFAPTVSAATEHALSEPPAAVLARLRAATEHQAEAFTMVSKLSPGGIVMRVLRAPETEQPFFGRITADGFLVGPVHRSGDVTPYQPLLRGTLRPEGAGSRLRLELAPHPHALAYDAVFTLAGGVILAAAAVVALNNPPAAAGLAAFGAGSVAYPRLRAHHGFRSESRKALEALSGVLGAPLSAPGHP